MAPTTANRQTSSHAQTLSRGIRALEVLAEAYRILRTLEDHDIVTLMSVEPRIASTSVAQRPGSRHPVTAGAAGLAVRMQMDGLDLDDEDIRAAHLRGYATSSNEAVPGLSALAVPLPLADEQLASRPCTTRRAGSRRRSRSEAESVVAPGEHGIPEATDSLAPHRCGTKLADLRGPR